MGHHLDGAERRRARRAVILGGQRVDLIRREQLEHATTAAFARQRPPLLLASANLDHVYRFEPGTRLFETTDEGQWLVLLDGMPLVWACRAKTGVSWDKLAGADLLPHLLSIAERHGARVGFLGGRPDAVRRLAGTLGARWPDLRVTGHWTPSRSVIDDPAASADLAADVRAAGTELLVVGLGKPTQERWMATHGAAAGARVTAGFGAAADYLSGAQKRAPAVVSRIGAEWLYRLAHDPRRLARRYLAEGPVALARVARDTVAA